MSVGRHANDRPRTKGRYVNDRPRAKEGYRYCGRRLIVHSLSGERRQFCCRPACREPSPGRDSTCQLPDTTMARRTRIRTHTLSHTRSEKNLSHTLTHTIWKMYVYRSNLVLGQHVRRSVLGVSIVRMRNERLQIPDKRIHLSHSQGVRAAPLLS